MLFKIFCQQQVSKEFSRFWKPKDFSSLKDFGMFTHIAKIQSGCGCIFCVTRKIWNKLTLDRIFLKKVFRWFLKLFLKNIEIFSYILKIHVFLELVFVTRTSTLPLSQDFSVDRSAQIKKIKDLILYKPWNKIKKKKTRSKFSKTY